jgi:hypothetical protein
VADELFPEASKAVTVMAFEPATRSIRALHVVVPVAVPDAPVAPLDHVTVVTVTLSLAVPPRLTGPADALCVGADVGVVMARTGGTVSPPGGEKTSVRVALPAFPAASRAVSVIRLLPGARGIEADQAVVPAAVPLPPVRPFVQVTEVTPRLSAAVPLTVAGLEVAVAVGGAGVVITTVGGVVSPVAGVTVSVTGRVVLFWPLVTLVIVMVSV